MKLNVYTVFDSKASAFKPPFFLQSNGEALRAFGDAFNNDKHDLGMHPEDYTLFHLGSWDDKNSQFELLDTPKSLGIGVEFVTDKTISLDEHKRVVESLEQLQATKEQAQ